MWRNFLIYIDIEIAIMTILVSSVTMSTVGSAFRVSGTQKRGEITKNDPSVAAIWKI